jgi:uncharacterized protein (TIGR04255 family)
MANRVRFEAPPVMEVVFGVLFASLPSLRVPYVGAFWDLVRTDFPIVDEVPPLPAQLDGEPGFRIEIEVNPQLPRTWLKASDESALLQLQRDRFLYNWKRPGTHRPYPSYDHVMPRFEKYWALFASFVERERLGSIEVRQYELTYVNHIPRETIPSRDPLFVDHIRDASRARFLPEPESYLYRTIYELPEGMGRLSVSAGTSRTPSGEEPIRLDMTARGIAGGGKPERMRDWFNVAHDWIVRGFADLTTARMQNDVWRRIP